MLSAGSLRPALAADPVQRPQAEAPGSRRTLTGAEVFRAFQPYLNEVRDCYLRHGARQKTATGRVVLEFIINRAGRVEKLDAVAPGVSGKKLEQCIRKLSEAWSFPDRDGFTTAVIPLLFVKTNAPGAGPSRK